MRDTFGSDAEFRALIAAAHALGLRVILDFVPNHFSGEHRYFNDIEQQGRNSPFYEWFDRDSDGEITHYFDWEHLHNLNYDNAEVQNYTIAALTTTTPARDSLPDTASRQRNWRPRRCSHCPECR